MEVHAHTHSHDKKSWKAYFWEFLMLFLAVFCGFLAENQREHLVERHRAKEYAESLYKDLQNDTADIRQASLYEDKVVMFIDSLVDYISMPEASQKKGMLYYYLKLAGWQYSIDFNRATMNQLINSGSLRYFTNSKLVTLISNYNTITEIIISTDDLIGAKRTRAIGYKDHILLPKYQKDLSDFNMDDIFYGRKSHYIDSLKKTDLPLQKNSAELIDAFANAVLDTKGNRLKNKTTHYARAIGLATEIMELLKKEYNLK